MYKPQPVSYEVNDNDEVKQAQNKALIEKAKLDELEHRKNQVICQLEIDAKTASMSPEQYMQSIEQLKKDRLDFDNKVSEQVSAKTKDIIDNCNEKIMQADKNNRAYEALKEAYDLLMNKFNEAIELDKLQKVQLEAYKQKEDDIEQKKNTYSSGYNRVINDLVLIHNILVKLDYRGRWVATQIRATIDYLKKIPNPEYYDKGIQVIKNIIKTISKSLEYYQDNDKSPDRTNSRNVSISDKVYYFIKGILNSNASCVNSVELSNRVYPLIIDIEKSVGIYDVDYKSSDKENPFMPMIPEGK